MDRVQAHQILTETMIAFASEYAQETDITGLILAHDVTDAVDGTCYSLELKVDRNADGERLLLGAIHDNNPSRFDLLEERMTF